MTVLLDARPYAVAVRAALDTALAPNKSYEYRQVPGADGNKGTLPPIFVLVSLERRSNPLVRQNSARAGAVGWRLATRSAGRTVDECRWAMSHVSDVLNEKRLLVAGEYTTRIQFESDEAPAWDEERFTAVAFWTFVH